MSNKFRCHSLYPKIKWSILIVNLGCFISDSFRFQRSTRDLRHFQITQFQSTTKVLAPHILPTSLSFKMPQALLEVKVDRPTTPSSTERPKFWGVSPSTNPASAFAGSCAGSRLNITLVRPSWYPQPGWEVCPKVISLPSGGQSPGSRCQGVCRTSDPQLEAPSIEFWSVVGSPSTSPGLPHVHTDQGPLLVPLLSQRFASWHGKMTFKQIWAT